jgi:hypothetical protein
MLPKTALAGVVALGRVAHACKDTIDFVICLEAASKKECSAFNNNECDRTCGYCKETDCYDKIPANDAYLLQYDRPASSIWPNYANDGGNTFPAIATGEKADEVIFPFQQSTISAYCKQVFDDGACKKQNTKYGMTGMTLNGAANQYCAFTCGMCKVTSNASNQDEDEDQQIEINKCWRDHNANMHDLATINSGNSWNNNWGSFAYEEEQVAYEDEQDLWEAFYSFSRKRRSAGVNDMSRSEILAEAVESMIFPKLKDALPLSVRNRRGFDMGEFGAMGEYGDMGEYGAWGMGLMLGQQQTADHEKTLEIKAKLAEKKCWKSLLNEAKSITEEAEEAKEGEEGEGEDPVERVRGQRKSTDHEGMKNWVADNSPEGTRIVDGVCSNYDMIVEEAVSEMELAYTCQITCESGTAFMDEGGELVSLEEGLRMVCSKENYRQFNKPADCTSPRYCVGSSCHRIVCIEESNKVMKNDPSLNMMANMFASFMYESEEEEE